MKNLYVVLCFWVFVGASERNYKPVTTQLFAKWKETPFTLETAEYLNDESQFAFWGFIDALLEYNFLSLNAKEIFEICIKEARQFLSDGQVKLLKLSLSLRMYSPMVEMFHQMAVDRDLPQEDGCDAVADVNGELTCNKDILIKLIEKKSGNKPDAFLIDHHFPGSETNKVGVVLYGDPQTQSFKMLHRTVCHYAKAGTVDYVYRPYIKNHRERKVALSGYGVELQIKSTEYKAQDDSKIQEEIAAQQEDEDGSQEVEGFVFSKLSLLHPEEREQLQEFQMHLLRSSYEIAPMKVWQLQHLSMQTAQRIMAAPDDEKLHLLMYYSQNFPMLARPLIRTEVDAKMKNEILKNQNSMQMSMDFNLGDSAIFINGMHFDIEYTDIYTLFDHLRKEQKAMEGLFNLGFGGETLSSLLNLDLSEKKQDYGIDIRDSAIYWLNNIETDQAYQRWPSSISELLRPTYPGMLRSIRKNMHNLVLILDLGSPLSMVLLPFVDTFLEHSIPIRIGLILVANKDLGVIGYVDAGVALLCAYNYVVQSNGGTTDANRKGLQFLINVFESKNQQQLRAGDVVSYFKTAYRSADLDDIFGEDSDYDVGRKLSHEFVEKGGFKTFPQALMNGVPLPEKHLAGDEFEELVLMEVMKNSQTFQKAVFKGELTDRMDVVDYLMSQPNIMPRLNSRVLTIKASSYIPMHDISSVDFSSLNSDTMNVLKATEVSALVADTCQYVTNKKEGHLKAISIFVVGDFDTLSGQKLIHEALRYTRESDNVRICFIHNLENTDLIGPIGYIVEASKTTLPSSKAHQLLLQATSEETVKMIISGEKKLSDLMITGIDIDALMAKVQDVDHSVYKLHSLFVDKVLGIGKQKETIIVNGRMLGVLEDEGFNMEDFALLERFVMATVTDKILPILKFDSALEESDLLMKVSGIVQTIPQSKSRTTVSFPSDSYSVIKLPPRDLSRPSFKLVAMCDPASSGAQKIAPLLNVLYDVINAEVQVFLNAAEKHSEMPLKSFYRYVLQSEPQFGEDGKYLQDPMAKFVGLPESPIFTLSYHIPENWLVEVVKSIHDLDNIKLDKVETGVHSEFELENLLLEGHCFEQSSGNPPRGLQFTLGTHHQPVKVDTIVMANLGYFQLKASPGSWILRLRQGPSADIYNIASHEGTDSLTGSSEVQVLISSFKSHVIKIRVAKKPEKQFEDLLSKDDEDEGGLWSSITSSFNYQKETDDEAVNVFSLASGHLYERFLRIMMYSVTKSTKSPVKFWLLKNFLSPSLKDSLPVVAKELGFEYELVQYKWPRWLHQQTEKQRIIWGYKILFLDVLFPLDIKKIIFVDADQVVRGDIKELNDLNLEGAPYGFVPFCDSREEMEGFRFWKHGYWKNHLAGRKYHISALFVVDLKKFRKIAAGDRLRGQYQGLSQDPNSLSNLDQDLPNNMIHQVRIKSLPMEWLWCETWCDDRSKANAKIIDVCNNPMTKEAKLDAAQRIIEEWTEYDSKTKEILNIPRKNQTTITLNVIHEEL